MCSFFVSVQVGSVGRLIEARVLLAIFEARSRNKFDSAVLQPAFFGEVVRNGLRLAEADGLEPIDVDALAAQVGVNRFGAALRQVDVELGWTL